MKEDAHHTETGSGRNTDRSSTPKWGSDIVKMDTTNKGRSKKRSWRITTLLSIYRSKGFKGLRTISIHYVINDKVGG